VHYGSKPEAKALVLGLLVFTFKHGSNEHHLKLVCRLMPSNFMESNPFTVTCCFQVDKFSLTTNRFHSYYGGSEIIVAGKVTSSNNSNKEQMDEDLGAEVHAWSGAEHKEVLYKPLFISEKSAVR
jgi:hypothetical protein